MNLKQLYYNLKAWESEPFFEDFWKFIEEACKASYSPPSVPKMGPKPSTERTPIRKGHISVPDFLAKFDGLASKAFIHNLLNTVPSALEFCGYREGKFYYVVPDRLIYYLAMTKCSARVSNVINKFFKAHSEKILLNHPEWAEELKEVMNGK